jgi:hypothetical protein
MTREAAIQHMVEMSEFEEDVFCLRGLAKESGSFIDGLNWAERDNLHTGLHDIFKKPFALLRRDIFIKARFRDYAQLDKFIRRILKNYTKKPPFLFNDQILWPCPRTLLCKDGRVDILEKFEFTAQDALEYLDRATVMKSTDENDAAAVLKTLLTIVKPSDLSYHALVDHRFYKRHLPDTIALAFSSINSSPDQATLFSLLDYRHIADHHMTAGQRLYEFEHIARDLLANPQQLIENMAAVCKFLLLYMFLSTPFEYDGEQLKRFIEYCVGGGVDVDALCDIALVATVSTKVTFKLC